MIESAEDDSSPVLKFFGYKQDGIEPRLHEMDYTRELHEQLQKLQDKLSNGQPVLGTLQPKEGAKGKKGDDEEGDEEGDGSESQKTQWEFHELRPSDFLSKPTD